MNVDKKIFERHFFNHLSGKDIKIGIIDTGIDDRVVKNVINCYNNVGHDYNDYIGHGTKVAQIIKKLAPMSLLYNIKIFDDCAATTSQKLLDSIKWAISQRLNIINLSLGTKDMSFFSDFDYICKKAISNDIFIVSAIANDYSYTLPAVLDSVIGVASSNHKIADKHGYYFLNNGHIQCIADGSKYINNVDIETHCIKTLTSYAAPFISSVIALILEYNKSINYLELLSLLNTCSLKDSHLNLNYVFKNTSNDFLLKKNNTNLLENKYIHNSKKVFYFPLLSEQYYFNEYIDLLNTNIKGITDLKIIDNNSHRKNFYEEIQFKSSNVKYDILNNRDILLISDSVLSLNDISLSHLKQYLEDYINKNKIVYFLITKNQLKSIIWDDKIINYKNLVYFNQIIKPYRSIEFCRSIKNDIPNLTLIDLSTFSKRYLDIQLALRRQFMKKNLSLLQISTIKYTVLFGFDFVLCLDLFLEDFPFSGISTFINYLNYELLSSKEADLIFYSYDSSPYYQYEDLLNIRKCNNALFIDSCLRMTQPDSFILVVDQFIDLPFLKKNIECLFIQFDPDFIVILLDATFPSINQDLQVNVDFNQKDELIKKINSLIKNISNNILLVDFSNLSWPNNIYEIIINFYK